MKISYYVLAGQIGDQNLYKAEALAHFLNRNLPFYHFEIVRVPPSQWHSFVEYLIMKLWHPQRFLYYHRLSTKVHKAISKIVEVNDSMPLNIKYKPWEILEKNNITESKSKSIVKENSKDNNSINNSNDNSIASNTNINNEKNDESNTNINNEKNTLSDTNINNEKNALSNSPSKVDDKNKIINISLDTVKQTIVISTEDIPLTSNNINEEENNKNTVDNEKNKDTTDNENLVRKKNSSVSLFSDDHTDMDGSLDMINDEKENNKNDDEVNNIAKNADEIISTEVEDSNNNNSNVKNSNSNINNSKNSSFDDLNIDEHDIESNTLNSKINVINNYNTSEKNNNMDENSKTNINNNTAINNTPIQDGINSSNACGNNDIDFNENKNETYYKLPNEIDIHIQSILEELPQFTWKVDGEFIGDCESFFDYIKNNYGYQIHMDDDMLEDIADEDIKIQKYNRMDVPVVFSTSEDPYFKNIPHLSETTNNVSLDYAKKNGTHLTIKKFRHLLNNTMDDIKYDDYINKTYYKKNYSSESLNYSDLEIDSEDLDEIVNNDDNYYYENEKEDYIRSPVRRYHKYVIDGNGNTADSTQSSDDNLITPVNSKYTPSTKPQTDANMMNGTDNVEHQEESIEDKPEIEKNNDANNNDNVNNNNTKNIDNNNNDDNNVINNNTTNEDDEINYSYKGENNSDSGDMNDQLNEQLSNDEITEQIDNSDNIIDEKNKNDINKDEIVEDIVTENNEVVTSQEQPLKNNEENVKVVSSSNSSKNILRKTISGSKGSLQKLN